MKPNITAAAAFARTWLPLSNALRRLFSIALLLAVSPASVNAQLKLTEEQQAAARERTRVTYEYLRQALLDRDQNGWEDLWEKAYPAYTKDKNADPDGDGITNWEEMLDGTDPGRANKKGEIF